MNDNYGSHFAGLQNTVMKEETWSPLLWIFISNHLPLFWNFLVFSVVIYLKIEGFIWRRLHWVCHVLWDVNINCSEQGHQMWTFKKDSWTLNLLEPNIWALISSFWFVLCPPTWVREGTAIKTLKKEAFTLQGRMGQSIKKQTDKRCLLFYVWLPPHLWSS